MPQVLARPSIGEDLSSSGDPRPVDAFARALVSPTAGLRVHPEWHGYSVRHDAWRCRARVVPYHVVFACFEGVATGAVGSEPFVLEPGGMLHVGPGEPMDMTWPPTFGFAEVYFALETAGRSITTTPTWRVRRYGADVAAPLLQRVSELLLALRPTERATRDPRLHHLLALVVLEAHRPDAPADGSGPRLSAPQRDRVVRFIRQNLHRRVTLAEVARAVGLSPDYCSRVFRRTYGMPLRDYVIRQRVARARRMLRETDLPITRVAQLLGYANVAQFSKQYRQHAGLAPTATRTAAGA